MGGKFEYLTDKSSGMPVYIHKDRVVAIKALSQGTEIWTAGGLSFIVSEPTERVISVLDPDPDTLNDK